MNTRAERFGMWIAYKLGGYGSPSLAMLGRAPTLRWTWTGKGDDARKDPAQPARYVGDVLRLRESAAAFRRSCRFRGGKSPGSAGSGGGSGASSRSL